MGISGSGQTLETFFKGGTYFQIGLDSANFHEGSLCNGNISFELTSNQPPLEVYVALIGYENVLWKERRTTGTGKRRRTRIVTIRDAAQWCSQRFMVMKANDSFMPGQYTYPFSFQLPAGMPGTYVHKSGAGSSTMSCSCTYTLYWELSNGHDMVGRAMWPIVMMQKPRTVIAYDVPVEISKTVTTWCCCNKGQINLKCLFEKSIVWINETVSMKFNADLENCKIDVTSLKACLLRRLRLCTRNGRTKSRSRSMIVVPVQGVEKGEKTKDDIVVTFDMNQAMDLGTPSNLQGALGEFAGRIQQTCNGTLISCTYELDIVAEVNGCICCDAHPTAMIPIEILAPEKVLAFVQFVPAYEVPEDGEYDPTMAGPSINQSQIPVAYPAYAPVEAPATTQQAITHNEVNEV